MSHQFDFVPGDIQNAVIVALYSVCLATDLKTPRIPSCLVETELLPFLTPRVIFVLNPQRQSTLISLETHMAMATAYDAETRVSGTRKALFPSITNEEVDAAVGPWCQGLLLPKCTRITDELFQTLLLAKPWFLSQLVCVDVSSNTHMTDDTVLILAKHCPKLVSLSLMYSQVTDEGLKYLHNLQHLDVFGCEDVTDVGLQHVAVNCPKLRRVDISRNLRITDAGLIALVSNTECCMIETLYAKGCRMISDVGVRAVLSGAKHLVALNVTDCFKVTQETLEE
eukprot:PhF_6_TR33859/c0_g1_i3/m.49673